VCEGLGLPGYDAVSVDKCSLTLCNITVLSPSEVEGTKKVHFWSTVCVIILKCSQFWITSCCLSLCSGQSVASPREVEI
jgi:hypothetical protein